MLSLFSSNTHVPFLIDVVPAKKQKREPALKKFDPMIKKKRIEMGEVSKELGGLLDRDDSIECLFKNLEFLATKCGQKGLDKKDVPLLAIAAPSESGKTEFMKWINNHCCTDLNPDVGGIAMTLLKRINGALPDDQKKFDRVLVLFASFNQTSVYHYQTEKGIIVQTTIERLLRSHQGNVDMSKQSLIGPPYGTQHFCDFESFPDIVNAFAEKDRSTAFIFCIDELSKFHDPGEDKEGRYEEYKYLLDNLLVFSHVHLREGGYCAIVGSALTMVDVGGYIIQKSGRALAPIFFGDRKPTIKKKAMELFLEKSSVLECADDDKEKELFNCAVKTAILESYTSIRNWGSIILGVDKTTTRMRIKEKNYPLPETISKEDVFEVCSRTLFNTQKKEGMDTTRLKGIVDKLHGGVRFSNGEHVTDWDNLNVLYSLPAHRLLQLKIDPKEFEHVQSWAINSVYKIYYTIETKDETVKAWELATIALLDLRRAMQYVANDKKPLKLSQMFVNSNVHHNLENNLLNAVASHKAAQQTQSPIPFASVTCDGPTVITADRMNEKGIEGVFRNAEERMDRRQAKICCIRHYRSTRIGQVVEFELFCMAFNERTAEPLFPLSVRKTVNEN